ncbi:MAG: hypothetical protein JJU03_00700 [Idiomarina sp.]|nr:hypothetical protein [Idiomarina sp.]
MSQPETLAGKAKHQVADDRLAKLIQRGYVFNARQRNVMHSERLPTGYRQLDKVLGGGLMLGALHEVQTPQPFSGESVLFKAALQRAQAKQQPVFWLNPPALPFLPGLQASESPHTIVNHLQENELQWAAAQVLQELHEGVVLIWQPTPSAEAIRQWQRAIRSDSQVYALVICQPMAQEARAYCNRLRLNLVDGSVSFEVLKRQGGWPAQTLAEPLRPWS